MSTGTSWPWPADSKLHRIARRIKGNDPTLTELRLSRRGIGDDDVRIMAELLLNNTYVTKVVLNNNGISAEGARALAALLRNNTTLKFLSLAGNSIGNAGARLLAEALPRNSTLKFLYLGGNSIGNSGARALADALLGGSSLADLDLSFNYIYDEGAREFVEVLRNNSSLTILRLVGNKISIISRVRGEVTALTEINRSASSPQEALSLKVERLAASDDGAEAAVSLTLDRLDMFPSIDERRDLFGRLLGSERGRDVAASVDVATGRTLFWLAADCGAAPGALMNVLRAHPSLGRCRDVRNRLYPFMLIATRLNGGVGDVMDLLLQNPALVMSGIPLHDDSA